MANRHRKSPRGRPIASREISAGQIVDATLQRIRAGGFANVSMRQVADDLRITATALYHHFPNKDGLLDAVAERIYDSIPRPDPGLPWTLRLRQLVLDQQRVHLDHPGLAHFALVRHSRSTAAFRWLDSILEVLHEGGLDDDDVVACLNQIGFLQNPLIYLDAPERVFEAQTSLMDPSHRRVLAQPERFPYLARMADKVPGRPYEANFELALDTVIAALEVRVRGRPVPGTARRTPARGRARAR